MLTKIQTKKLISFYEFISKPNNYNIAPIGLGQRIERKKITATKYGANEIHLIGAYREIETNQILMIE